MREIKFRALSLHGDWNYGLVSKKGEDWFISNSSGSPFAFTARPETIGQFTGLKDKNGKEIYEGDIVSYRGGKKPRNQERGLVRSFVVFKRGMFTVDENLSIVYDWAVLNISEIIGNVHQNPELLK